MRVTEIQGKQTVSEEKADRPAHWANSTGTAFHNPWPSWRLNTFKDKIQLISHYHQFPSVSTNKSSLIPIQKPTWGMNATKDVESEKEDKIKATWLGHACFLVEFPSRSASSERGVRILFDPVFSGRCSPSQWVGPKRFTPPPCKIEEIPEIDAVVISHNHYDHLDTHTIRTLSKRNRMPHFFAPLGNSYFFESMDIPHANIHIMDWWNSKRLEVAVPSGEGDAHSLSVDITCTPGQHFTGRTLLDNYKTLWASWAVEEVRTSNKPSETPSLPRDTSTPSGVKVFFAGDTGYRSVLDGQDENNVPTCPVFKQIGERFGGFDLALIPIGAYMPRQFMSPIHCAPQDSVLLFKDVKARRALGMHWGTWVLTSEDVMEPPKRLAEECKKVGIEENVFGVCNIGETTFY